jgi:hypothetical protein
MDVAGSYNGVDFTRRVIHNFRESNINIVSYFISYHNEHYGCDEFNRMYGADAQFINPGNMMQVAKTLNSKFLEIAK